MKQTKYCISVDLGGTKILAALVSQDDKVLEKQSLATEITKGYEQALDKIVMLCTLLTTQKGITLDECVLSVCAPGPIDLKTGSLIESVNLGWGSFSLRNILENRLSIPVFLEHDAKASALGEFHHGRGRGEQSMVYIVVGTGVGGAIIIDGKLYRGMHNYAGELGHFTIDYDGDPGLTDIPGNVQSFMAGPSLANRYIQRMKALNRSLPDIVVDGEYVGTKAQEGDKIALAVLSDAAEALGICVANLAMILDIELFVVGSSVAKLGELFIQPARTIVPQYAFRSVAAFVRIESSTLQDDAALLGSAYIAKNGQK